MADQSAEILAREERLLRVALLTTGPIVSLLIRDAHIPEARRLAVAFAQQGLRAARLLGLYRDDDALAPPTETPQDGAGGERMEEWAVAFGRVPPPLPRGAELADLIKRFDLAKGIEPITLRGESSEGMDLIAIGTSLTPGMLVELRRLRELLAWVIDAAMIGDCPAHGIATEKYPCPEDCRWKDVQAVVRESGGQA